MTHDLDRLLEDARNAGPHARMGYRDRVAEHGAAAIDRLTSWLHDPDLYAFAIRAVGRAGEMGARDAAVKALTKARPNASATAKQDIDEQLTRLGAPIPRDARPGARSATGPMPKGPIVVDERLRRTLITAARERRRVTYSEIGEPIGLSMRNPGHRGLIGRMLGAISEHEALFGRPLLSSIVVHKGEKWPGPGFFQLGEEQRRVRPGDDPKTFALREMDATFEYWATHEDPDEA